MVYFIVGPMKGRPASNKLAFERIRNLVIESFEGACVIIPHDINCDRYPSGKRIKDTLSFLLTTADVLVTLNDYESEEDALLADMVACAIGMKVYRQHDLEAL